MASATKVIAISAASQVLPAVERITQSQLSRLLELRQPRWFIRDDLLHCDRKAARFDLQSIGSLRPGSIPPVDVRPTRQDQQWRPTPLFVGGAKNEIRRVA
jgi:hypothetical protein